MNILYLRNPSPILYIIVLVRGYLYKPYQPPPLNRNQAVDQWTSIVIKVETKIQNIIFKFHRIAENFKNRHIGLLNNVIMSFALNLGGICYILSIKYLKLWRLLCFYLFAVSTCINQDGFKMAAKLQAAIHSLLSKLIFVRSTSDYSYVNLIEFYL